MTALIAWTNFGPYHIARIRAAQERCSIVAMEWAGYQHLYRWEASRDGVRVVTLTDHAYEDCSRVLLAIRVAMAVVRLRPRVVFVPGYSQLESIALAVAGRVVGARLVLMTESNRMDRNRRRPVEFLKALYVRGMFRYGLVGGKRSATYLAELGIPEERQRRNYDVVDVPGLTAMAAAWKTGAPRDREFLYVGRFAPEKNVYGLLRGFARYRDEGGDWTLSLVGHGPLEEQVRLAIREMGLDDITRMTGYRPLEQLVPLYCRCGAFVLPSVTEPWGLVVNEAITCGAPILVSDRCGCAPELLDCSDSGNGLVIEGPKDEAIAEAMHRMANFCDDKREAMSRRSENIAKKFRPEEFAQSISDLIEMAERGE